MKVNEAKAEHSVAKEAPGGQGQIRIISDASKMSTEGLMLQFPDGFIVKLTPTDISMAIATEAFRKRCQ